MRARNTQHPAQNPTAASRKANPASALTRIRTTPSASKAKAISADVTWHHHPQGLSSTPVLPVGVLFDDPIHTVKRVQIDGRDLELLALIGA